MVRWSPSSEKMSTTVNTLASDVNASIDFVLEASAHLRSVIRDPTNRYAMAKRPSLCWRRRGRIAMFGIGASGILAEYAAGAVQPIGLPVRA